MSNLVKTSDRTSLMPQNLTEAMKLADMMAQSDIVPKDYKGKPANILTAIQLGLEIGVGPMQALQNIACINGRPCVWGDLALAVCQNHPSYEYHKEWIEGDKAYCAVKRKGCEEHVESFSIEDAKRAGLFGKAGPWSSYPRRMMQMRARSFALRNQFADALKGLGIREEIEDMIDVTPKEEVRAPLNKKENLLKKFDKVMETPLEGGIEDPFDYLDVKEPSEASE